MIWPKDAHHNFVIGEYDDTTGKIIKEWVVKPGEEFPKEALVLLQEAWKDGEVPSLDFSSPPFYGKYDSKIAEKLLRKQ